MNATLSPIQAHEAISKAAANPDTAVRIVDAIAIGEHVRQGDVYLQRIDKRTADWKATTNRQLAPGTSQGSRHIVDGSMKLYASPDARPLDRTGNTVRLLGPQIVAKEPFMLTHPEHAHFQMPAGVYQCSYQLDWSSQQAVRD